VIADYNPGVQERPALVRRNPKMQAPLRKGKREETLGRAKGVKRTGRSLLFGLLLVALVAASSLLYTWERLRVESMLEQNLLREKRLDLVRTKTEGLASEVVGLESLSRIELVATSKLGMALMDWDDVIVIEETQAGSK
jgi:cell division protein FtsL